MYRLIIIAKYMQTHETEFDHYCCWMYTTVQEHQQTQWWVQCFTRFFRSFTGYPWLCVTHLPLNKMAAISQTIFSNAFNASLNENIFISIKISLKFIPNDLISSIPALVQIMAWRRPGTTHYLNQCLPDSLADIWGTRVRWVNWTRCRHSR